MKLKHCLGKQEIIHISISYTTYTHTKKKYGGGEITGKITILITVWIQMGNKEICGMILERRFFNRIFGGRTWFGRMEERKHFRWS